MVDVTSLLPANATSFERAAEQVLSRATAVPVDTMWNPETCPPAFLPWLAWALSVDDWDANWTDDRKRAVIAASVQVHRRKGTVWAIKAALAAMGYGNATIIESKDLPRLGKPAPLGRGRPLGGPAAHYTYSVVVDATGAVLVDAQGRALTVSNPYAADGPDRSTEWRLGWSDTQWADYWIVLNSPVQRDQADALAARLKSIAPARCRLRSIRMAEGVRHVLGRDVWALGANVPLGGVYQYEVTANG